MADLTNTSLGELTTEARNPQTTELDSLSALEIVHLINSEDAKIALAVEAVSEPIAEAIDIVALYDSDSVQVLKVKVFP